MSNSGKKTTDDDEVEQLLRAAQDDMLLKLNVNSHMARGSASAAIDPDLDRRFKALKKPQKPPKVDGAAKLVPAKVETGGNRVDGGAADDDLFARFTALKSTIPSHNRNENKSNLSSDVPVNQLAAEEEESEDEVEKVIKWAIDAARLDPSPSSDEEEEDDDDDDDDDYCSDDEDDDDKGKKKKRK